MPGTRASQFNYLIQRAFHFLALAADRVQLPVLMRPRSEGGTYRFGVLQPEGEMSANYNGYWIWRDLRGKMVLTTITLAPEQATSKNVHAISSRSTDGRTVSTVLYYDTGYLDGASKLRAGRVTASLSLKLPPDRWQMRRSTARSDARAESGVPGVLSGNARLQVELRPCEAVSVRCTRMG